MLRRAALPGEMVHDSLRYSTRQGYSGEGNRTPFLGYGCGVGARGSLLRRGGRLPAGIVTFASMNWKNRRNERVAREENVPGTFFVDRTCIDCDTCRWMAPDTFARVGSQSAVVAQPEGHAARVEALRALLSCPTFSIHANDRTASELREAQDGLPARVPGLARVHDIGGAGGGGPEAAAPGAKGPADAAPEAASGADASTATSTAITAAEGVYYTGWATEKSFAGCAYLIVRPGGNILVDSPRFNPVLARRIEALGGVRYMFLTHRDDVGDHAAWARHFGATRILHELEVNTRQGTDEVEVKLSGEGPWTFAADGQVVTASAAAAETAAAPSGGSSAAAADDVTFILTPGHSAGHVCMLYAPYRALFSGDHLCSALGEVPGAPQEQLFVYKDFNWYDFRVQLRSVAKLLQYDWLHVLPAHGRRAHFKDAAARLAAVSQLLMSHGDDSGPDVLAAATATAAAAGHK